MIDAKPRYCPADYHCAAAAAAKGAALMLREQKIVDEVEIILAAAETARYRLYDQSLINNAASCYAIRESGNMRSTAYGGKIYVSIKVDYFTPRRIVLQCEPAAGPAARREIAERNGDGEVDNMPTPMILEVVREVFAMRCIPSTLTVTVAVSEDGLSIAV